MLWVATLEVRSPALTPRPLPITLSPANFLGIVVETRNGPRAPSPGANGLAVLVILVI